MMPVNLEMYTAPAQVPITSTQSGENACDVSWHGIAISALSETPPPPNGPYLANLNDTTSPTWNKIDEPPKSHPSRCSSMSQSQSVGTMVGSNVYGSSIANHLYENAALTDHTGAAPELPSRLNPLIRRNSRNDFTWMDRQGSLYQSRLQAYGDEQIAPNGTNVVHTEESNFLDETSLIRYQKELMWRQQRLEYRRRALRAALITPKRTNLPPRFLCIRPFFYHNISEEIVGDEKRRFVKLCLYQYMFQSSLILFNFIVSLIGLVVASRTKRAFKREYECLVDKKSDWELGDLSFQWGSYIGWMTRHFVMSFLYLFGVCFAWATWYFPTYRACVHPSHLSFLIAFVGMLLAFLFALVLIVGNVGFGGCGWVYTLQLRALSDETHTYVAVAFSAVCTFLSSLHIIVLTYLIYRLRWFYSVYVQSAITPVGDRTADTGNLRYEMADQAPSINNETILRNESTQSNLYSLATVDIPEQDLTNSG